MDSSFLITNPSQVNQQGALIRCVPQGAKMDVLKRLGLMLCIGVFSVGACLAKGLQEGPASASTTRGAAYSSARISTQAIKVAATQATTTFYGPPYYQYGYSTMVPGRAFLQPLQRGGLITEECTAHRPDARIRSSF
jgi:hypothetical protein